jgi:aminoglycoside phosphotransferase (APT) family kinase protein
MVNSIPQTNQAFERLVQTLAPQSKSLRAWQLKGGISTAMTALEFERPAGQISKVIVRQPSAGTLAHNPRAAQDEFTLLQLTHALGLATPTPYRLDQSGEIFPAPYLVIEYIEGAMEFSPANLAQCVLQLATHLARIHRADCSALDLSFLPPAAQRVAEHFGERPAHVDTSLDEGRIRDVLESVWPIPQRNASALLHGDYWPGNVLWRDGQLVAVIDWEDAAVGDPLADFAISRLDILWILGLDAFESFTRYYQAMMPMDYTYLPYWDLCAALRLVHLAGANLAEWAAYFIPFGRHDITEQTFRDHYRFFVTQAFEKLAEGDKR